MCLCTHHASYSPLIYFKSLPFLKDAINDVLCKVLTLTHSLYEIIFLEPGEQKNVNYLAGGLA